MEQDLQQLLLDNVAIDDRASPTVREEKRYHPFAQHSAGETEARRKTMILIDAPIRGLSAQVTIDTASAVKNFFDLCQAADPSSAYIALPEEQKKMALAVNAQIGKAVQSQRNLLNKLEHVSEAQMSSPDFQRVVPDLERLVAQGDSAISTTYTASDMMVRLWKTNLEILSDQNGHIDNYVESFRIAFDENCTVLLADMATQVANG